MATVVVVNGRHQGEWYTIGEGPKGITFGRSDKLLAGIIDPRVSQEHLRVFRDGKTGDFVAEDLNSRNGTRVNGRPIESYILSDGDVIQIGHTLLGFSVMSLEEDHQRDAFIEKMRSKAGGAVEHIESREEYTEAAALFSRLFGRKNKPAPKPKPKPGRG